MNIRTKLMFALQAVALGSMFTLGLVVAPRVQEQAMRAALARLDDLADAKAESVHWILEAWRASAERLAERIALGAERSPGTPDLDGAVADAFASVGSAEMVAVYDLDGHPIAGASSDSLSGPVPLTPTEERRDGAAYAGVEWIDSADPRVVFEAPLSMGGERVGTVLAAFGTSALEDLTTSYGGLGEMGEVLLVAQDDEGAVRTLHRTRSGEAAGLVLPADSSGLGASALADVSGLPSTEANDRRGRAVWAATRRLPETGWGLIVKVDREEQMRPVAQFNRWLRRTALILAAFSILIGGVLGVRFTSPIRNLSDAAERMRSGDFSARARVRENDEIGMLAWTFNDMARNIQERMAGLAADRSTGADDAARGLFVANTARELREPLARLLARSGELRQESERGGRPEAAALLRETQTAGTRLLTLIDRILDLLRIESGTLSLECTEFDVQATLDEVESEASSADRGRGRVQVADRKDYPLRAFADPRRARQALLALVDHLVSTTGCETVELGASATAPEDENWVEIRVGAGGPRSGDPTEPGANPSAAGPELGLEVARRLADLMGGDVTRGADEGVGLGFVLRLPRRDPKIQERGGAGSRSAGPG